MNKFFNNLYMILAHFWNSLKNELLAPWGAYYVIMGVFWVCFYIFIRFFRNITGYKIIELQNNITYPTLVIFVLFVLIHFFILISMGWFFYIKSGGIRLQNSLLLLLTIKASEFKNFLFWKPLETVYNLVSLYVPFLSNFILFLERYFTDPWEREEPGETLYFTYLFIVIFDVLPKVVVSITFFIEVIFYEQVNYFLKFLPIIIIPILFKIFIKIMKTVGEHDIYVIKNYFTKLEALYSPQQEPGWRSKELFNGSFAICENYNLELDEKWVGYIDPYTTLVFLLRFQNVLMQAYLLKTKIEAFYPYVSTFTSSLYFIAGLVRLYIIFLF